MALDKIKTAMIEDDAVTAAKIPAGAVGTSEIADDAVVAADLGTMMSVGETAPAGPFIGQRWFRLSTGVTYQYTNDGTSSFWLDVSSGGGNPSANTSVDFVGDLDPVADTNGSGLAVGSIYYNRVKNRYFECTTATTDANVWTGGYDVVGGVLSTYSSGGNTYNVHTFLSDGTITFNLSNATVEYLMVAGGGGGGQHSGGNSGGGGAGGVLTNYGGTAITLNGSYSIGVGTGGAVSVNGVDTTFNSLTAIGGGRGGYYSDVAGAAGGSGGGGAQTTSLAGAGTSGQGYAGGDQPGGHGGGGGGGYGSTGFQPTHTDRRRGGNGGTPLTSTISGTSKTYAGGGGGSNHSNAVTLLGFGGNSEVAADKGGGGDGGRGSTAATAGGANTGGGGGGGQNDKIAAAGGSGIVIIRYIV